MKLALGTAQFGMDYGVTNSGGRLCYHTVKKILNDARSFGVEMLDTANAYGDAEEVIGNVLQNHDNFKIISKTQPISHDRLGNPEIQCVIAGIEQSFRRLRRESIYAILVHNANDLLQPHGKHLFSFLEQLKREKRIHKIGVSVYSPEIANVLMERYPIDLIQFPMNLLDQRMAQSGMLQKLKHLGVELHVRSVFLQGILLAKSAELPVYFSSIMPMLVALDELSRQMKLSKMAIILGFIKQFFEIDQLIIGVLNEKQLEECWREFNVNVTEKINYETFECTNLSIIDPSQWKGIF